MKRLIIPKNLLKVVWFLVAVLAFINLSVLNSEVAKLQSAQVVANNVKGTTTHSCPKKFYVPLASAKMKSFNAWGDTGAEIYIDTADYPGGTFSWEASLRIPTGNGRIYARLINVNENVEIWGSEIWSEGHNFKLVSSSPLTLWQGKKLYRVQFKTSMDYEAVMEGARIVVTY